MALSNNSLAAAVAASVKNKQFAAASDNVPHKIAIVGTYDPSKTDVVDETPVQVLSPEDVADRTGFGYMLHRLAKQVFLGGNGIEMWIIPQAEISGAAQAEGAIAVTAASVLAGTLMLYIAGIPIAITVTDDMTDAEIATAIAAEINDDDDLPVTASAVDDDVTITSKSAGPWGNDIDIQFNVAAGDEYPSGVSTVVTAMSGGSGTPDISAALTVLGENDDANENWFTELVHGYGQVTAVLDDISEYVGEGNTFTGLYAKSVARPFRSLVGDTVAGSAGLNALIALAANRRLDRANGVIAVPGSPNHPAEIAALTLGIMARVNNNRAAQSYIGEVLSGVYPGRVTDRWTNLYDSRDTAVKSGVGISKVQNGYVVLQNVLSFYRPASVAVSSNGYRSMRNISILQNILFAVRQNFEREKWQGISIVSDSARVTNATDREKVRDIDAVIDDLVALAKAWEAKGWIDTADYTIEKLMESGAVSIRSGTTGFDMTLKITLSGEGAILDAMVEFDTSIAVLG